MSDTAADGTQNPPLAGVGVGHLCDEQHASDSSSDSLGAFYWFSFRILLQKSKVKIQAPSKRVRTLPLSPEPSTHPHVHEGAGLATFAPHQAPKGKRPTT